MPTLREMDLYNIKSHNIPTFTHIFTHTSLAGCVLHWYINPVKYESCIAKILLVLITRVKRKKDKPEALNIIYHIPVALSIVKEIPVCKSFYDYGI